MYCTKVVIFLSVPQYLLLGTITGDVPLAQCTYGSFGPMDNSLILGQTVHS